MGVGEWARYQPVTEWMLVNVGLPIVGIVLIRLCFWLSAVPRGLVDIVKDGQVFFLCALVSTATVLDVWKAPGIHSFWTVMPPVATAFVSLVLFGAAVGATSSMPGVRQRRVAVVSGLVLVVTCTIVVLCRIFAGADHE